MSQNHEYRSPNLCVIGIGEGFPHSEIPYPVEFSEQEI